MNQTPEHLETLPADVRIKRVGKALAQITEDANDMRSRTKPQEIPSYELQRLDFAREVLKAALGDEPAHSISNRDNAGSYVLNFEVTDNV